MCFLCDQIYLKKKTKNRKISTKLIMDKQKQHRNASERYQPAMLVASNRNKI